MLNGGVEICGEDCTGCAICAKMGKASPLHSCFPQKKDAQVLVFLPAVVCDGFRRGGIWVQKNQCQISAKPAPNQHQIGAKPVPNQCQTRAGSAMEGALGAEHKATVEMDETLGECCEVQIKSAVLRAGSQRGGVEAKWSLPTWDVSDVLFIHFSSTPGNGNNFF